MQNNVRTIAPSHNQIRTEVVTTYQQMLHAYAIRSICFMEEHGVKARQTFDGNDYQATHMIVYAGDEPVGTQRIRWFKDFAKLERTAFREAYRNTHVLKASAYFVFDHVARKGYDKVITHAQPKYARLWRIVLGFKNAEGKQPLYFDGHRNRTSSSSRNSPLRRTPSRSAQTPPFCSGSKASGMRRRSTRRRIVGLGRLRSLPQPSNPRKYGHPPWTFPGSY